MTNGELRRGGLRRKVRGGMAKILALWSGDLALDEAFWTWTVAAGLPINIAASILFLAQILQDRPLAALVADYAISVVCNAVGTVKVWRSTARYAGPSLHADLARIARVILMTALKFA